jgi:hypothetical protein
MRRKFMIGNGESVPDYPFCTIEALEEVHVTIPRKVHVCTDVQDITDYTDKSQYDWWETGDGSSTIFMTAGKKMSIKCILQYGEMFGNFQITGKCNLLGNCNTLIFGEDEEYLTNADISKYGSVFQYTFKECNIVNISDNFLPATVLADYCYMGMFKFCMSLINMPKLPATTLRYACYQEMFYNCTSFTSVKQLPATTLADFCYSYMFSNCTNLQYCQTTIPATTLAYNCCGYMFGGCTSLKNTPTLPATSLTEYCYFSMFYNCSSITTAPELPATTLKSNCYNGMFHSCGSLVNAPTLPALTLVNGCYSYMFMNCSKLNYIKAMFTNTPLSGNCANFIRNTASTGTFVMNKNANWNMSSDVSSAIGLPSGWTVIKE